MRVLLFGATGMVGQGVLRECLLADDVESVVTLGRTTTAQEHPKLPAEAEKIGEDRYRVGKLVVDLKAKTATCSGTGRT